MAEEMNQGVAYLAALRKVTGTDSAAAVAAAPAHETSEPQTSAAASTAAETSQFKGAEKRRSPRYKCEGSVQLAEDGCEVHTWAKFTDVSLHGCYVEAQATYPVGTGLNMKMELNGVRLDTRGTVRVNYPYLGMGIAFVDMSDENRERLKNLLSTVTYSRVIVGPGVTSVVQTCSSPEAPHITNPDAAVQALVEYFQNRHILTREDFQKVVAKSQGSETKR